jgi:hypothetical protein
LKEKQVRRYRFFLILIRLRNYVITKYTTIRKRIVVFLIFFVLSASFWFYRALDDTYADNIKYPLKYINLPQNKILASHPLGKITLRVRGNGYTLLNNKLDPPTLELNVNDFSLGSQSIDSLSLFLISRQAKEIFAAELSKKNNDPLEILSTYPDTILFSFTKTRTKKIPVYPEFSNKENLFSRQYMLNGKINITPENIVVVGPYSIIDTLSRVYTEPMDMNSLKDSVSKKVKLKKINGIRFLDEKVKIQIPVDKFTEATIEKQIDVKNAPDSLNIKVFPRFVRIKYKVTLSQYDEVAASGFKPYIKYADAATAVTPDQRIKVYIDTLPEFAHSVEVYPKSVEFLIERKNVKNRLDRRNR